tara:strand:- start:12 stop:419 length:408 start_codon:yes stop_codon:yes gene_type:complete
MVDLNHKNTILNGRSIKHNNKILISILEQHSINERHIVDNNGGIRFNTAYIQGNYDKITEIANNINDIKLISLNNTKIMTELKNELYKQNKNIYHLVNTTRCNAKKLRAVNRSTRSLNLVIIILGVYVFSNTPHV